MPANKRRFTPCSCLLYGAIGLIVLGVIAALVLHQTLPYDLESEVLQVAVEEVNQRVFHMQPPLANYTPQVINQAGDLANSAEEARLMQDLTWLADDARLGRQAGTPAEDTVGSWLAERFKQLGLVPFHEAGLDNYVQTFDSAIPGEKAENIIAVLPGTLRPNQYVLISAHYDGLGVDADGQVYNGADDDATGVAAVLEAARVIAALPQKPQETIVFVLFSGEEGGRRGSSALGNQLLARSMAQQCQLINLEVLGAAKGQGAYLDAYDEGSLSTAPNIQAVQLAALKLGVAVRSAGRDPGSDATRLLAKGVPSISLDVAWEGGQTHPDDHQVTDDVQRIDPRGFLNAARVAIASTWLLANDGQ